MAAEDYLPPGWDDEYFNVPALVTCKLCGKKRLHWESDDGEKWYLANDDFEKHVCSTKRLHKKTLNDFEDLP